MAIPNTRVTILVWLSPSVMQEKIFGNPDRKFPRWTRALLSNSFLAVFDNANGISDAPSRLWLLSEKDMAAPSAL